jgi:hypothetical protein
MLAIALFFAAVVEAPNTDRFVVHEWGTFNQMQDAFGVSVDGMQHEDEELPDFVIKRLPRTPSPWRAYGDDSCLVRGSRNNTKMETPVLYFYSDRARRAVVDVKFQGGLMTEWFPRADATPAIDPNMTRADLTKHTTSSLHWDIDVLDEKIALPEVDADEPWSLARVASANHVRDRQSGQAEGYLFYRGLGNLFLPPRVMVQPNGDVMLMSSTPISAGILIEMDVDRGRFMITSNVGDPQTLDLERAAWLKKDVAIKALGKHVETMLVAQGLYREEAQAMVATWSRTWFEKRGMRWLYVVPQKITEQTLPLNIEPKPTELVRVLVGRLEVLPPQSYAQLLKDTKLAAKGDVEAKQRLASRGRFLEPSLRIALRRERDEAQRLPVISVLKELLP